MTKIYRGINVDTTAPGFEKVHDLITNHGMDHLDVGGHLLDALGNHPGLGKHWSEDPAQAEPFSRWPNEETGRGGNLQAVIAGDWNGEGADPNRTDTHEFDENGQRIRSFPWEKEHTLSSDAKVNVTGLKIRPHDDAYWNGPSTNDEPVNENHDGPWHQVPLQPSLRTASDDEQQHGDPVSDFLQWCADNGPDMPPDQESLDQYAELVELTPEEVQSIQYFLGYFEKPETLAQEL